MSGRRSVSALPYLGGKSRVARSIASVVRMHSRGRRWWDPFCGGLSVSLELSRSLGPGTASDINPSLIALYASVKGGWVPPSTLSEAEYRRARDLPDDDPLKAFAGFGCSFGGKWFGGYARDPAMGTNYAARTAENLKRIASQLRLIEFRVKSFWDESPRPLPLVIYADPPYANTEGYKGTVPFDHQGFWARVQEWESCGVPVLVSEYACPVKHRVLWRKRVALQVVGGDQARGHRVESVFRVLV